MLVFWEIVLVALGAIRANALRSILTTLGIVIGVAAVIAMVALGEGAQSRVEQQIQRMGTNVLTVRPGQSMFRGVRSGSERLTEDDARALREQLGGRYQIAPELSGRQQVSYLRWNSSNDVLGTWPSYFDVYDHSLSHGRFFDEGEVQGRRRVAVLGYNVPEDLGTPASLLVGQTIQIRGMPFEVVGVLNEKGGAAWVRPDDQIFIPLSTAMYRVMGGRDYLRSVFVAAPDPEALDQAFDALGLGINLVKSHRMGPMALVSQIHYLDELFEGQRGRGVTQIDRLKPG